MLRWPAFLLAMVVLQLLESTLAGVRLLPDLGVVLVVFLALFARRPALPALLAIVATVRAPLCGTAPSSVFLQLGVLVLLLLPLRRWFFHGSLPLLALLSLAVTLLLLLAHRLHVPDRGGMLLAERSLGWSLAAAAVLAPLAVLALCRLPPTAWFVAEDGT